MEARSDDLKWFGEGFDGFPKHLPEDCVEYFIFILDPKLEDFEVRSQLRHVQSSARSLTKQLLKGYIWQRQGFKLELVHENGLSFLRGHTNYGDSIEDEWLIVYLMLQLSKQHKNTWTRIIDTDGEFLLIEAANVLPVWLNPESGTFRSWVKEGKLYIVPDQLSQVTPQVKKSQCGRISLQEALRFIQEKQNILLHSPLMDAEAFFRVQKYPGQITGNLHHSMIRIPRKLAYLLHHNAAYISPAIDAFYLRDPISLRPLQTSDKSKLTFPPEDFITASVAFTKVGFAQARSQQFTRPLLWQSILSIGNDSKSNEEAAMGMKVTCGFEMMLSDPHNMDNSFVREINLLLDDLATDLDHLPSNEEISLWDNREDDDSWLDIDFQQFEDELMGNHSKDQGRATHGFGDRVAQENLRKIVTKFEDFLNDNSAGLDGAELDPMDGEGDGSEDEITSDETESDEEDEGISFDEDQFSRMMKEMMGMPMDTADKADCQSSLDDAYDDLPIGGSSRQEIESGNESGNESGIREVMNAMQLELTNAGVFQENSERKLDTILPQSQARSVESKGPESPVMDPTEESDAEDARVDVDYNLAKNLLESFKSQHGMAGPGGNLLGLLGVRLPRDENDDQ